MAAYSIVTWNFFWILSPYIVYIKAFDTKSTLDSQPELHYNTPNYNKGYDVIQILPNQRAAPQDKSRFTIFCYKNQNKSLLYIWKSVQLELERVPTRYQLFSGENETEVFEKYQQSSIFSPSSWFGFNGRGTILDFPAFTPYCIGISTNEDYFFNLKVRSVNYWKLLQMILGFIIYLSAPSLSKNSFFHYTSGMSIGVCASALILIFVISRFLPKKSASYAVLFLGYSFVLYILQSFWNEMYNIIVDFKDFFLAYCLISSAISFFVCYRFGPVKNPRTFNMIQWLMQLIGLLLIFFSSEYREVPTAMLVILFSVNIIPSSWVSCAKRVWYRYFPPKVKLLTEIEYIEQGNIETKKALESLRNYCSSPDCNAWKVISRLKDPVRFASFIEKGSHFTDNELLEYNSEDIFGELEYDTDPEQNYTNC